MNAATLAFASALSPAMKTSARPSPAVVLAERIRDAIAAIRVAGVDRAITVSIGVADLIQHGGDAPGLLRQADRALYTAKATGRNRVVIAGDNDQPESGPTDGEADPALNGGRSAAGTAAKPR